MENNYATFRRAAIGGFNREDVISYIEKMKNEFYDYKKEVEKTITGLNEKIKELEASCGDTGVIDTDDVFSPDDFSYEGENDAVSGINEAAFRLRAVADELCRNLCAFMEKVSENAVSVVISAEDAAECEADENEADENEAVEQEALEADESTVVIEEVDEKNDAVSEILKAVSSFSYSSEKTEKSIKGDYAVKEKENILNILNSAGFLS